MRKAATMVLLALGAVLLLAGSCSRGGRIIPRKAMEDIYYDMFLADQWLMDHSAARKVADTTLFYEPIFREHGYSFKDFDKSVTHYLRDPEKFAKMLKNVSVRLEKKQKALEAVKAAIDAYSEPGGYVSSAFTADSLVWADSLVFWARPSVAADSLAADSLACLCCLDSLGCRCDSLCCCLDSLKCRCDSLCCCRDSLKCRCDSLCCRADSLKTIK